MLDIDGSIFIASLPSSSRKKTLPCMHPAMPMLKFSLFSDLMIARVVYLPRMWLIVGLGFGADGCSNHEDERLLGLCGYW